MMGCRRVLLTLADVVGAESDLLRKREDGRLEEDDVDVNVELGVGGVGLLMCKGSIFGTRGCGIGVAGDEGQVTGC